jgi:hypothetical protein
VRVRVNDNSVTVVHNPDQISIDSIKYQIKHSL